MSPEQRTAVYALAPALALLLVVFGIVTEEQGAAVAGALLAVLGCVVAFAHRPTKG